MKRRAAIYHRVSKADQDQATMRAQLRRAALGRGFRLVLNVEETGSGSRFDRPGLRQVLEAARQGKIDAVLVWKLDRFGRSARDLYALVSELRDVGCSFVAVSQGIELKPDRSHAGSELLFAVLAGVAEFEHSLIRERTRAALERKRALGIRLGRPPVTAAPDPKVVSTLRRWRWSWTKIARETGYQVMLCRRAVAGGKA